MERLTHKRVNGIKQGYWTAAKKEELINRLAAYEDTGLTPEEIINGKMLGGFMPCSEKLPVREYQIVLCVDNNGYYFVGVYAKEHGFITQDIGTDGNAVAWQPIPEPWKGDKE